MPMSSCTSQTTKRRSRCCRRPKPKNEPVPTSLCASQRRPDVDAAKLQLLSPVAERCVGTDTLVRKPADDAAEPLLLSPEAERCADADELVREPDDDAAEPLLSTPKAKK